MRPKEAFLNSSNISSVIFSWKQEHCEINNSMLMLLRTWKKQNIKKEACIFEIMTFTASLEPQLMWQPIRNQSKGLQESQIFSCPFSGSDSEHLSQTRWGKQRSFSRTKLWMQKSWIIPKLAAEVWRIWKSTRRAQQPARCLKGVGQEKAEGQPDISQNPEGKGSARAALEEKCKARQDEKEFFPKRPAADWPYLKEKSCLFYQNW